MVLRQPRRRGPGRHHRGEAAGPEGAGEDQGRHRQALPGELADQAHGQVRQRAVHPAQRGEAARQVQLPEARLRDRRRAPAGRRGEEGLRLLQGPGPRDQAGGEGGRPDERRPRQAVRRCSSTSSTPATSSASPAGSAATCRTRTRRGTTTTTTAGRRPTTRTASSRWPRRRFKEHFEVLSVTFQDEKVNSRAIPEQFGWRFTPYAYVLLKPRGPQGGRDPALAAGPRLPRHVGLRGAAGRVAEAGDRRQAARPTRGRWRSWPSRRRSTSGRPTRAC